jgi:hypothetical protein
MGRNPTELGVVPAIHDRVSFNGRVEWPLDQVSLLNRQATVVRDYQGLPWLHDSQKGWMWPVLFLLRVRFSFGKFSNIARLFEEDCGWPGWKSHETP